MSISIVYYKRNEWKFIDDMTIISNGEQYIGQYDCGKVMINSETGDVYVVDGSDTTGDINVDVGSMNNLE